MLWKKNIDEVGDFINFIKRSKTNLDAQHCGCEEVNFHVTIGQISFKSVDDSKSKSIIDIIKESHDNTFTVLSNLRVKNTNTG